MKGFLTSWKPDIVGEDMSRLQCESVEQITHEKRYMHTPCQGMAVSLQYGAIFLTSLLLANSQAYKMTLWPTVYIMALTPYRIVDTADARGHDWLGGKLMIYVCVECPECGQGNEVDETLTSFFCLKCGTKCDLEFEPYFVPGENAPTAPTTTTDDEAKRRLKRVNLFIEDGDWERAWSYCESILDYDPENAEAYLAELLVAMRLRSVEELRIAKADFRGHSLFQKALRFADEDLKKELVCLQPLDESRSRHRRAKTLMEGASHAKTLAAQKRMLQQAANLFDSLGSFEDSKELADKCRRLKSRIGK